MTARPNLRDGERGSVVLESVILFPVLVAVIGAAIAAGRVAIADGAVEAAARDAARTASIARTAPAAERDARTAATTTLRREGLQCDPQVRVDTSGFARAIGVTATVAATITCQVALADVALPGLPGSTTLTATFTSPLDPFRGTP